MAIVEIETIVSLISLATGFDGEQLKRKENTMVYYTWTPVVPVSGKLLRGNIGLFTSRAQAMEWAGFTCDHEVIKQSDIFSPDESVCERFQGKHVYYLLNTIGTE